MPNHYKDLKHQHQRLNALDKRGDLSKVIQTFEVYYPKLQMQYTHKKGV